MRTIEKTVYKFSELPDDGKQKAIENLYDINVDYEWYDYIFDDAKTIGLILGIDIERIYFSGFYSQGDGACFEGSYSYKKQAHNKIHEYAPKDKKLHEIADRLFDIQRENGYKISAIVKHSGHYYHYNCTNIKVYKEGFHEEISWYGNEYKSLGYTAEYIKDCLKDFMKWIYKQLQKEYEYRTSEEVIIETIEAGEYEFYENGKLF